MRSQPGVQLILDLGQVIIDAGDFQLVQVLLIQFLGIVAGSELVMVLIIDSGQIGNDVVQTGGIDGKAQVGGTSRIRR